VFVAVCVGEGSIEGVSEGDEPTDSDGVCVLVIDTVEVTLGVADGDKVPVPEPVPEDEPVPEVESEPDGV
jgi:hypothetical protein